MPRRLVPHPRWITLLLIVVGGSVAWLLFARSDDPPQSASNASGRLDWAATLADLGYEEAFEPPAGPWQLSLPADHGAHSGTRSESWLLSGTLTTWSQQTIGVQLGLLRFALAPEAPATRDSPWRTAEVYRGHLTFSNVATGAVIGAERYSRAAVGLAGHDPAARRVWLEDWALSYGLGEGGQQLRIEGEVENTRLELLLAPQKAAAAGDQGQGRAPFRGFALTRLEGLGTIRNETGEGPVTASLWLDHLWGEVPLPLGPIVWDRVQLQLDDGSEVFVLRTRRRDGRGLASVSGYRLDSRGRLSALETESTRFVPTGDYWRDGRSGARYPLTWQLATEELELEIEPLLEAQVHDFAIPLWSGVVRARGQSAGESVSGTGFLELTGYEPGP